ncbi:MAG: Ig-like domain repeat protein [Fimbriimonadales bacterium]|nr:Ig-like domain repeat protein [Fimbriimonadales bacterium]
MGYAKGLAWLWMLLLWGTGWAQSVSVSLRFHDAVTGRALPAEVQILGAVQATYRAGADGRLTLNLPEGEYTLYATAEGYQPVGIPLHVAEPMLPIQFYLDPLQPPREVQTEFLWSLRKAGMMTVVGWVMDEVSGQPLAGVQVSVMGAKETTQTDSRGFFLIQFPVQKLPYATLILQKAGYRTRVLEQVQVWSGGDWIYRLTMEPGTGTEQTDMRSPRHRDTSPPQPCDECEPAPAPEPSANGDFAPAAPAPIVLPKYIRVGRNCTSRTNCQRVEVYTLETYCKGVITSEWYACWGNVAGGMESLKAGAVAVRSYGVSFVYSPATSSYDICDSTSCQVFTGNQTSNGNAAVDATTRYVLLTSSGTIARAEYSAENNNAGCGDGYSGTGSSWPCIADPVCAGFATNGHGRGMCQWGSARWATGRRLSSSQACTSAAPQHGYGTKNWQQILSHYYGPAGYQLVQGGVATITNLTPSPNPIATGTQGTLAYTIDATHDFSVILGASIRTGGGDWLSDPTRDLKVSITAGTSNRVRFFQIPPDAAAGMYDVLTALWYDRNNSNSINTGDFMVDDRIFTSLWQVRRATSLTVSPASGRRGASVVLQATLRQSLDNAPIGGQTLTFKIGTTPIGTATTDASGTATLPYTIPLTLGLGNHILRVEYAGSSTYHTTVGTNLLTVQPVLVQGTVALEGVSNPAGREVRFTVQQGSSQEVFTLTLGTGGAYQFETSLAGSAMLTVSTLEGSWLCQQAAVSLSNTVSQNFSLPTGDINRDGVIDDADLLAVLFAFGQTGSSLAEDLNRDGVVDDADLLLVLFNFGQACGG